MRSGGMPTISRFLSSTPMRMTPPRVLAKAEISSARSSRRGPATLSPLKRTVLTSNEVSSAERIFFSNSFVLSNITSLQCFCDGFQKSGYGYGGRSSSTLPCSISALSSRFPEISSFQMNSRFSLFVKNTWLVFKPFQSIPEKIARIALTRKYIITRKKHAKEKAVRTTAWTHAESGFRFACAR